MNGSAGAILGIISTAIGIISTAIGMNRSFKKEREKERTLIASRAEEDTKHKVAILNSIENLEKTIDNQNRNISSVNNTVSNLERNLKEEISKVDKNSRENYDKLYKKLEEVQRETIENTSELGIYKEFLRNSNVSPVRKINSRNL